MRFLNPLLRNLGYEIHRSGAGADGSAFRLFEYQKPDGSFDYAKYKAAQISGNHRKIDNVWVREENVEFLSRYIKEKVGDVKFGICHGTRRGKEQEWFRQYLGGEIVGTEISDTATQFPNTIQWDFHEVKPEWRNSVDFIYSNSLDHSYDPKKCLDAWMSCLTESGICILEHSSGHERAHATDPFGAYISQMPYLILRWGDGAYCAREILDAPSKKGSLQYMKYIVIQRV
jgi:hypothetical protein